MTSRALTLALRLLTAACAGGALGAMSGCPFLFDCPAPWSAVEMLEVGTQAELLASAPGSDYDRTVMVGAGGVIVHYSDSDDTAVVANPVNVTLRGVVAFGQTVVVGDNGTILSSADNGETWTPRSSPTQENLLGVTWSSSTNYLVAISLEQVLISADEGETWTIVNAPAQGWGGPTAVFSTHEEVWVVGAGGSAWAASDPAGAWLQQELGTTANLIGGGRVSGTQDSTYASGLVVASDAGLWFRESGSDTWTELTASLDGSIAACDGGYLVTNKGVVYDVDESGRVSEIAKVGLAPRTITSTWSGFFVAGEAGNAAQADEQQCVGGRPWIIDGELTTATVLGEIPACSGTAFERVLAAAWVQDGLYEHASIASFARMARDLMSLGAPQSLVGATLAAQRDELEHTRLCFEIAADCAGKGLRPGSLPLGHNFGSVSHSRAGDPAAIAIAMFDEGCINESLAAAEAAVAAAVCTEPKTKASLARIARDEARHAALAWRTVRWLLETHAHEVLPALRQRLARLRLPSPIPSPVIDDDATSFAQYGRLSTPERTAIQRRVFAEMIAPLATQMLQSIDARVLA